MGVLIKQPSGCYNSSVSLLWCC